MRPSLIHVNRRIAFPAVLANPLKILILAGQSNMQGHAMIQAFALMGKAFAESAHKMMPGEGGR